MGQKYSEINEKLKQFIQQQKIFFVGTATADSRVNISPKGMDTLRVLDSNRIVWLNVTGSGNETAAHIQELPRMTLMFVAYEGSPMILRVYGTAKVIHQNDAEWTDLYRLFSPMPGARQLFDLKVELVQTSCGMSIPLFEYVQDRDLLTQWANKKGDDGIREYWEEKNQTSLDGKPTNILQKNT